MASLMMGSICTTSRLRVLLEISNSVPSASCMRSYTSSVSSKALVCTMLLKAMSCRLMYFCKMMRAWNSMFAALDTLPVSSLMRTGPPTSASVPLARSCSVTVSMSMGRCMLPSVWMAS